MIGLFVPIFFGYIIPWLNDHAFRNWIWWIGLPLVTIAFIKPMILKFPYILWIKLGTLLGFVNSRIILIIVFFFILFPLSIVMKVFGYDPLKITKVNLKTYREKKINSSNDLTRIF